MTFTGLGSSKNDLAEINKPAESMPADAMKLLREIGLSCSFINVLVKGLIEIFQINLIAEKAKRGIVVWLRVFKKECQISYLRTDLDKTGL
jgi:tetrahydromethanopterin S-methyltransferase subunit C